MSMGPARPLKRVLGIKSPQQTLFFLSSLSTRTSSHFISNDLSEKAYRGINDPVETRFVPVLYHGGKLLWLVGMNLFARHLFILLRIQGGLRQKLPVSSNITMKEKITELRRINFDKCIIIPDYNIERP
ncbi:hypothetical protein BZA77DRAFT_352502 [Pyronema omphalodes]|nr:hypothetical protein BZA77DRAFT_352502 [Pyronema omphalodes]